MPVVWRTFNARIVGVTPLLMHNPAGSMGASARAKSKSESVPPPEVEAERGLYRLPSGELYVKADHVRESMLNGAAGYKIGKATLRVILSAAVMILEPEFVLSRGGQALRWYDRIDIRRAVVQKQGISRARPVIETPWECLATFVYDSAVIRDCGSIVQALQQAGQVVGLLDYRPQKRGQFGRFIVAEAWTETVRG
jgi:hypothetical protein